MNAHRSRIIGGLMVLILVLLGGSFGARVIGADPGPPSGPSVQASAPPASVLINEVMPKPEAGNYEWVELINRTYRIHLPVVLRGFTSSATLTAEHGAAPLAALSAGADLDGYQITDEDGHVYTIPAALPPVPPGALVLIYFGDGTDDYDFSDGKATLYTGSALADIFEDAGDQVSLYSGDVHNASTIVDFMAWGIEPQEDAANAAAAGLWQSYWFLTFESGLGDTWDGDVLAPNESLGRYPGGPAVSGRHVFTEYGSDQLSPGAANPVPLSSFFTPEDGAIVETTGFSVGWRAVAGASRYRFQLDDDPGFGSPLYNTIVTGTYFKPDTPLPEGTYYWRIRAFTGHGQPGPWLGPVQVGIVTFSTSGSSADNVTAEVVLGITPVRQNKDSRLLCLDGDPEGNPATDTPENAWDAPAPCTQPPCADTTKYEHGRMYCVVASIRMMASYYGGELTMDRIAYHIAQEWTGNTHAGTNDANPNNDLAHNNGWSYHDEEDEGISWALGTALVATDGKPDFADIKAWIDAGRPIMFRRPGHLMVMDGYREEDGNQFIHILDPDQPPDFWRWQDYDTQNIFGYWPGPVSAPGVRSDEASVSTDTDGDGIMDFDEIHRFGTNPYRADSDGDWVNDKQDMREYVFNAAGAFSYRSEDWDGDTLRKELDCDNDNDGSPDGCEDVDGDGIYEAGAGETDNFSAASQQDCVLRFAITHPTTGSPLYAGPHNNPDTVLIHLRLDLPDCWAPLPTPVVSDFEVTVGSQHAPAPILSLPVGDETWILVEAPAQSSDGCYTLQVTYDGTHTDSQTEAICYEPRLATDEVIVLDVSGSMGSYNKLTAAQNAARLFIDQWTTSDLIGVVAFSTTVSTPYPLDEITTLGSGGEQEAAKNAIDSLISGGLTAMGSGLLEGQKQLDGRGVATHTHTMVLLGDGMENVSPLWTDASVHDTIVEAGTTVHVVALGPPEAAWYDRLENVADETGGEFWPVDENATKVTGIAAVSPSPFPLALANRLADAYKSAAELAGHMQRLWEARGTLDQESRTVSYKVEVEPKLGEAIFSVNWNDPTAKIELSLEDPSGHPVHESPPKVTRQTDATHDQYRIQAPQEGTWIVTLNYLSDNPITEYLATLAAPSDTIMGFHLGLPPERRIRGASMPMLAYLADHKPIAGGIVTVTIRQPNTESQVLQLFDDGKHGDGKESDGVYGNTYDLTQVGLYQLKVWGGGKNNVGERFVRRLTRSFTVRPRVAYIYRNDMNTGQKYEALLEHNGLAVDLVALSAVTGTDLSPYSLFVVGPDTGYMSDWGSPDIIRTIDSTQRPVLGLGEGGYAFFGRLRLAIGYPNGAHGSEDRVEVVNSTHPAYNTPYPIPILVKPPLLNVYTSASSDIIIYMPDPPTDVTLVGRAPGHTNYYLLIQQTPRYFLWGFDDGPMSMTETGQRLFVNTAWHMVP